MTQEASPFPRRCCAEHHRNGAGTQLLLNRVGLLSWMEPHRFTPRPMVLRDSDLFWLKKEHPPSLTRSQGEISILTCSYSATVSYVQWYRLFPGESPVFLLSLYEDGNVTHAILHIDGSQLADSAERRCLASQAGEMQVD
uniref:Ig-like domain-containing protein n=1 Tax=Gopherus evgoodei TaxID=1825980 RepID=A0A8C4Y950_9SAUR